MVYQLPILGVGVETPVNSRQTPSADRGRLAWRAKPYLRMRGMFAPQFGNPAVRKIPTSPTTNTPIPTHIRLTIFFAWIPPLPLINPDEIAILIVL